MVSEQVLHIMSKEGFVGRGKAPTAVMTVNVRGLLFVAGVHGSGDFGTMLAGTLTCVHSQWLNYSDPHTSRGRENKTATGKQWASNDPVSAWLRLGQGRNDSSVIIRLIRRDA